MGSELDSDLDEYFDEDSDPDHEYPDIPIEPEPALLQIEDICMEEYRSWRKGRGVQGHSRWVLYRRDGARGLCVQSTQTPGNACVFPDSKFHLYNSWDVDANGDDTRSTRVIGNPEAYIWRWMVLYASDPLV